MSPTLASLEGLHRMSFVFIAPTYNVRPTKTSVCQGHCQKDWLAFPTQTGSTYHNFWDLKEKKGQRSHAWHIYLKAYLHIGNQSIYRDPISDWKGKNNWSRSPNPLIYSPQLYYQKNCCQESSLLLVNQKIPGRSHMVLEKKMEVIH